MNDRNDNYTELAHELVGLSVSRPWCGIGSALFLELGELSTEVGVRGDFLRGEANIFCDFDWRIENETQVECGSASSGPRIQKTLDGLIGRTVEAVAVEGIPPDLVVYLSGGLKLRTFVLDLRQPDWSVRLKSGVYLSWGDGGLVSHPADEAVGYSAEEREFSEWASETAKRWGTPIVEPVGGNCGQCRNFERIDGRFALLDFGVCSQEGGPFDGRVTNMNSGCPEYLKA